MQDDPKTTIFAILAREADRGVVIRRGPTKHWCVIGWDLRTHRFQEGQWFKGSLYPRRADLSPSGAHLIHFAAKHAGNPDGWTVISDVPFLTARVFHPWTSAWNGGGVFVDEHRYWLHDGGWAVGDAQQHGTTFRRTSTTPDGFSDGMGECPNTYLPRLERDGWIPVDRSARTATFDKELASGQTLRKVFHAGARRDPGGARGPIYWEHHELHGSNGDVEVLPWTWAEVHRDGRVFFGEDGRLFEMRNGRPADATIIRDFHGMAFRERRAPYPGIRTDARGGQPPANS